MKTALSAPLDDMNMNVGAFKMAPAHLVLDSSEYRAYLRSDGRKIILESDGEGSLLADAMEAVRPDEVILPFVLGDKNATYEASMDFYNDHIVGMDNPPRVMAVAQGETLGEWNESYAEWLGLEFIDIIGVHKNIEFQVGNVSMDQLGEVERRSYSHRNLVNQAYYASRSKPIHLIGMNNLAELELLRDSGANKSGFIRSISSVAPYGDAIAGRDWTHFDRAERHFVWDCEKVDFGHQWTQETKVRAYMNLMAFAEASGDHSVSYNLGRISDQDELIQPKEN